MAGSRTLPWRDPHAKWCSFRNWTAQHQSYWRLCLCISMLWSELSVDLGNVYLNVAKKMFFGNLPFHDVKDHYVTFMVRSGQRPLRPSHDLSQIHGLNDEIWHLIEACWNQEASQRPPTSQIVEQLRALPDRPADQRPVDNFEISFPSRISRTELNRPFSTLVASQSEWQEQPERQCWTDSRIWTFWTLGSTWYYFIYDVFVDVKHFSSYCMNIVGLAWRGTLEFSSRDNVYYLCMDFDA